MVAGSTGGKSIRKNTKRTKTIVKTVIEKTFLDDGVKGLWQNDRF
jgi:hypothetical protein